ncbi:hypothetical protein [Clostridium sulfidigenes]|uniref:hypothetical protein n=1 Tax=Clostridium sulfidigenes TaxID=318464 RepID=UPI003F88821A
MKKILTISAVNEKSPALRYRLTYPLRILEKNEEITYDELSFYSVKTNSAMNGTKMLAKIICIIKDLIMFFYKLTTCKEKYDIIIIKNYVFPFGGSKVEKLIHKKFKASRFIFDIDDGIYLNETRQQNRLFKNLRNACEKVGYWTETCDKVMLSNEVIYNDLNKLFKVNSEKVVQFLSCPYENQYFRSNDEIEIYKKQNTVNFIWLGSPHTQENLVKCKEFINELPKIIPNSHVYIIGAHKSFKMFRELNYVEFVDWNMENEKKYMQISHIGLNPLIDNKFEQRKSAFKVIQYYRAGIVPIVSDVGINKNLVATYGGYCTENFDIDYMNSCIKKILNEYDEISSKIYMNTIELTVEANKEKIKDAIFNQ